MAREKRYFISFLLFLFASLFSIQTGWAQVNPGESTVNADEAVFVEYTSTVGVVPKDSDGNILKVDPDDLSVDFKDTPSGRVRVSDFEPITGRGGRLLGYTAEISSSEAQELQGHVIYDGGARPTTLGDFQTKFQEISDRSITQTVEDNALADGEDEVVIGVSLIDDDRLPISGIRNEDFEIRFKAAGPPDVESIEEDSDREGIYFISITNTEAGSGSYELGVAGRFIGSDSFTFDPPPSGTHPGNSEVTASSPHDANGNDASTVEVSLVDGNGDPINDIDQNDISVNLTGSAEIINETFDSATGIYTYQVVNEVPETVTVTVIVDDPIEGEVTLDDQPDIIFEEVKDVVYSYTYSLTDPHIANGEDEAIGSIQLSNPQGEPINNYDPDDFDVEISSSNADMSDIVIVDDQEGEYEFKVTNNQIENVQIAIQARGVNIGSRTVEFLPAEEFVDVRRSNVDATTPHLADGNDASTVTVTLVDSSGDAIEGIDSDNLWLSLDGGNPDMIDYGDFTEVATGVFETELTSMEPASLEITAVVIENSIANTADVVFEIPEVSVANSLVEVTSPHIADGEDASEVKVTLLDGDNNPVSRDFIQNLIIEVSGDAERDGRLRFGDTDNIFIEDYVNETVETVTVEVQVEQDGGWITLDQKPEIVFQQPGTGVSESSSLVFVNPDRVDADGSSIAFLTVELRDDDNELISDVDINDINIDMGNSDAQIINQTQTEQYEFEVVNSTPETVTFTVSVDDPREGTLTLNQRPSVEFTEVKDPVDPELSSVSTSGSADADGDDEVVITVELRNSNDEPINNYDSDDFDIDVTGNGNATDIELVDDNDGVYEFRVTNNRAETVDVTISAGGVSLGTHQIDFEEIETFVDGSNSSVEATSPHDADGSDASTVTVELRDENNDPMDEISSSSFNVNVSGNGSASGVSNEGGGEYEFNVTNTTAETVTVTVTVEGVELDDTPQIVFEATTVTASASNSSVEATSPHNADGRDGATVTIDLRDENNNSLFDEFSFSDFDINLSGSATQGDNGESGEDFFFLVYNEVAETVTVTISVRGVELDDTPQIVFESEDIPIPESPIISEIEDVSDGIELRWEVGSDEYIEKFNIYRGTSASDMELYDSIPVGQSTYLDDDPMPGTNFYAVSAVNELDEEGDLSNLVNFYSGVLSASGEWRMVSTPVSGTHSIGNSITAFAFSNRYEQAESMTSAEGYWMKSSDDSAFEFAIRGKGTTQVSLALNEGWNMIGGIADNVAVSDLVDPGRILTEAPVYYYSNGEYQNVELLEPDKGYWLYASNSGTVELGVESSQKVTEGFAATVSKSVVNHNRDLSELKFTRNGVTRSLKIDEHHLSDEEKYAYLLPPPAPEQPLTVRSEDGFGIIPSDGGIFTVEAEDYPVTVKFEENGNPADNFYQLVLRNGNSEHTVTLDPNRTIELTTEYDEIALITSDSDDAIREHKLLPNYPNPFNPATTIEFQLRENTHVLLEVYDVSGRRVQVLANDIRQSGHYSAEFDGSNLASGMYMVRFQAGNEVQIRKITLIK